MEAPLRRRLLVGGLPLLPEAFNGEMLPCLVDGLQSAWVAWLDILTASSHDMTPHHHAKPCGNLLAVLAKPFS